MYLASFNHGGRDLVGVRWGDDELVPLEHLLPGRYTAGSDDALTDGMLALIASGAESLTELSRAIAEGKLPSGTKPIAIDAVRWHPPVRRPGKIVGVAMNNSASDARKISAPKHPMFFLKPRSSLLGHLNELEVRSYYGSVHPEPELAVVIGNACTRSRAAARSRVRLRLHHHE